MSNKDIASVLIIGGGVLAMLSVLNSELLVSAYGVTLLAYIVRSNVK